jgi:pimeloyl-ACP methyl ester carboxylesterase
MAMMEEGRLELAGGALGWRRAAPERAGAPSFVFVNALTGTTDHWEAAVAPALRAEGFGTLSYDLRGQARSPFEPGLALTPDLIVEDLRRLLAEAAPERPILAGLSIGGLFAAQAVLAGADARGLVLMNTLREVGPRIAWVNEAMPRIAAAGGVPLFMDAMLPLLTGPAFTAAATPGTYAPLPPDHGHMNLMRHASAADWAVDWSRLALPVLSITGHQDRVFLDPEVVDRLFARLPRARREDWPEIGHLLPLEAPGRLAESLARFGAEIEGRA